MRKVVVWAVAVLAVSGALAASTVNAESAKTGVAAQQVEPAALAVKARYSPLGATANGPSGPATAKFTAGPHCCPSTATVLTPTVVSTESDFQWVVLGLPWDNGSVVSVEVCYAISTVGNRTYISQTRISDMTTPNSAVVRLDDGTDRFGPGPVCYTVNGSFAPSGALSLGLKVVFGNTSDRITIGMVALNA